MKGRISLCAVGVLALFFQVGCGGDTEEPAGNRVPLVIPPRTAPTGVTATEGNAESTVTWIAPSSNGGRHTTGYTIRVFQDGSVVKSVSSTKTTATVTGLTNGANYTFTVAALNDLSEGPQSEPSAPVVPRAIPSAPGKVTATPGDRHAVVSWEVPADNGMPLTGYIAAIFAGDTEVARQTVSGTSVTFDGLTNGTGYRVTVAARNSVQSGPASEAVEVTPRTVPSKPRFQARATTEAGYPELRASCECDDTGGSRITNYMMTILEQGEIFMFTTVGSVCDFRGTRLIPGLTYTVSVRAINAAGHSEESEQIILTP